MRITAAIAAVVAAALPAALALAQEPFPSRLVLLVVHPSLPVSTVKDFVDLAKRKPGEIVFSSTGLYRSGHISMAMLKIESRT